MKYCVYCGHELNENADLCLNCGRFVEKEKVKKEESSKALSTISVIFGALSFYPLIFIGSLVGFITGSIAINKRDEYINKAKTGLWLSVGSFLFWFLMLIFLMLYVIAV